MFDKCFSASRAAIQPIPAAVTACLNILSLTSPAAKKLLELLAENKRLNLIEAINSSYQELLEQHNKTSSIIVNVANQPSDDNKKAIVEKLLAAHGEGSNIEFSEDPSIMGGLSIKIGDETLDLSIRGKVKKLVNQLNF